jgi:MFS family permease
MKTEFNINRLGLYIKRHLLLNINSLWIGISAILGTMLIVTLLVAYFSPQTVHGLMPFYLVVFFLAGTVFSSMIYSELNSDKTSYAFLTLPVSTLEKLIGGWIITSPVYILIFSACMFVLILIASIIAGISPSLFFSMDNQLLGTIGSYMVVQIVFLLGATTFAGNNYLKTLLAIFVIQMAMSLVLGLLGYAIFPSSVTGITPEAEKTLEGFVKYFNPFLFWGIICFYLLIVSYFKLKERQV